MTGETEKLVGQIFRCLKIKKYFKLLQTGIYKEHCCMGCGLLFHLV